MLIHSMTKRILRKTAISFHTFEHLALPVGVTGSCKTLQSAPNPKTKVTILIIISNAKNAKNNSMSIPLIDII